MTEDKELTVRNLFHLRKTSGEVGIEIEVEGNKVPLIQSDYWRSDNDGSLRGNSMEYVLSSPVKRTEVVTALNNLKKHLADYEAQLDISNRCGVHIHLNVQEFTFKQVMTFACLYLMLEEILVKFCGEEREGNLFCLRAKDADYLVTGLRQAMATGSLAHVQSHQYRYASINMTALGKYGSLEFRSMRSTEDFDVISQWVEILLKLKDQSLNFDTPTQLIEMMSANGADAFVEQILGPLSELVQCPDMSMVVMNGVRIAQNIAYTKTKEPVKRKVSKEIINWRDFADNIIEAEGNNNPRPGAELILTVAPPPQLPRGVAWTRELDMLWSESNVSIERGEIIRASQFRREVFRILDRMRDRHRPAIRRVRRRD